jgi:hypothetical protein
MEKENEKVIRMLMSSLDDLRDAGLRQDCLQSPDDTPLCQVYMKITSAIVTLSLDKISLPK